MVHASGARSTLFDHDPGPMGMVHASGARSTLFDHDPGPMGMVHASGARSMLFDYDPGPSNVQINVNKTCYDQRNRLRLDAQQLHVGDLVLVHRITNSISRTRPRKLDAQWSGPYRIREMIDDFTYYLLELDGTKLERSYAGNQLKRFFSRDELDNNRAEAHGTIRIRDALEADEEPQSGEMVIDEESMEDPMEEDVMENEL
jgi:hypothetical protein